MDGFTPYSVRASCVGSRLDRGRVFGNTIRDTRRSRLPKPGTGNSGRLSIPRRTRIWRTVMTDGIGERTNSVYSIIRALHATVIFPMFLLGQSSVTLTGVVEDESRAAVAGAKVV